MNKFQEVTKEYINNHNGSEKHKAMTRVYFNRDPILGIGFYYEMMVFNAQHKRLNNNDIKNEDSENKTIRLPSYYGRQK